MARFGLVGPTYQAQSVNADAQRCVNFVLERDESGAGRSDLAMYQRPGLKAFWTPPSPLYPAAPQLVAVATPQGQLIPLPNGRLLGIINAHDTFTNQGALVLYWVAADGSSIPIAFIGGEQIGATPLSFAVSSGYVAFVGPTTGTLFFGNLGAGLFGPVPAVWILPPAQTITGMSQIVFLDGYFLALKANSQQVFYWLAVASNPPTWDALDTFQVSVTADYVRALIVDHRELWLLGDVDTVVYSNVGDADNPFQPNPSGFIQQGIGAPDSLSQLDNTLFWIGGDVRGAGIAWRANGYTPQRVSNFAVETEWQSYSTIADAVGFPMQTNGHSLWVLFFPTANKTWVYDVANGNWLEWTHLLPDTGIEEAFRGWNHVYAFGKHLVGDWKTGNIYEMAWPVSDGAGGWNFVTDELTLGTKDLIRRWRRAPHIANDGERIYIPELQIFLESGLGPIPPLGVAPIDAPNVALLNVAGGVAAGTYNIILANYDSLGNLTEVSDQSSTTILAPRILQIGVPAGTLWYIYVSTDGGVTWVYGTQNGAGTFSLSAVALAAMTAGTPPTAAYRGPELMLRISRDGGHTWGNELVRDCGQAGEFAKRVRYLRLGQARDWVFEIAMTDPVPLRITDAVIPDYPSSRIVTNLRKQA